ncbi:MAG: hypothetical protein ACAI44_23925 [Candidatus Sericytochromatia bacterium]
MAKSKAPSDVNPAAQAAKAPAAKAKAAKAEEPSKADSKKSKQSKAAAKVAEKAPKKRLNWEAVACQFKEGKNSEAAYRAKVPGGWFVSVSRNKGGGAFFYPDPGHKWDGASL